MVARTPLGPGMLTGQIKSFDDMLANDYHRFSPHFQPENFSTNFQLVAKIREIAEGKRCTPAQLAPSCVKAQIGRSGMPINVSVAGARSKERVRGNAVGVQLSDADIVAIKSILDEYPVAGGRYPPAAAKLNEY